MEIQYITLICTILCHISSALEIITNPSSSEVSCGMDDNCTVICNETDSCKYKTFYFYDNVINMHCSAWSACYGAKIYTSNVQSFTAQATAEVSFFEGQLYTNTADIDVNFNCGPSKQACSFATFYYQNEGKSKHNCEDFRACKDAQIVAVSAVLLVCKTDNSCRGTSFILPTNRTHNDESSLTISSGYASESFPMFVYSLYSFTNFTSTDNTSLNAIYFVFGMRFNQYCLVSDPFCMNSVPNHIANESYEEFAIIDTYSDPISQQSIYNDDVLIFAIFDRSYNFTPPNITDTKTLSIICIRCSHVTFQLESVHNVILSDVGLWFSRIYGPINYFELNAMHYSISNNYSLERTNTIVANSFGKRANIYLGNATDVHINCHSANLPYYDCVNANIWSTLKQNDIYLAKKLTNYWDIDTPTQIIIHFDFQPHSCTFMNYSSNCTFLIFDRTRAPTRDPTRVPSNNPSQVTEGPSEPPTVIPTKSSDAPTKAPSKAPTKDPSIMPSHDRSLSPSKYPTLNPLSADADAVVTNYNISIDIIGCDTNCVVKNETISDVIAATLSVSSNVEIVSVAIVADDLVIRLSIATEPSADILTADVISSHLEKEVKDNDDLGEISIKVKKKKEKETKKETQTLQDLLKNPILLALAVAAIILCFFCCLGRCYLRRQKSKQNDIVNANANANPSPLSPKLINANPSPLSVHLSPKLQLINLKDKIIIINEESLKEVEGIGENGERKEDDHPEGATWQRMKVNNDCEPSSGNTKHIETTETTETTNGNIQCDEFVVAGNETKHVQNKAYNIQTNFI